MSKASVLAVRYAGALYGLAAEKQLVDELKEQLSWLSQQASSHLLLGLVVRAPIFSRQQQRQAMDALLEASGSSELLRWFIGVLICNRRLSMLESICRAFESEVLRQLGHVEARVVLARAVSDQKIQEIRARIQAACKQELIIKVEVDAEILGGMVLYVGSRVMDLSLKSRLSQLRKSLDR